MRIRAGSIEKQALQGVESMQSYYPVRKMRAEHRDHSRTSVAKRRAIERRKLRKIKEASRA